MRGLNLRLDRVVYKHRYMRKPVQDRFFVFLRLSIIGQRTVDRWMVVVAVVCEWSHYELQCNSLSIVVVVVWLSWVCIGCVVPYSIATAAEMKSTLVLSSDWRFNIFCNVNRVFQAVVVDEQRQRDQCISPERYQFVEWDDTNEEEGSNLTGQKIRGICGERVFAVVAVLAKWRTRYFNYFYSFIKVTIN